MWEEEKTSWQHTSLRGQVRDELRTSQASQAYSEIQCISHSGTEAKVNEDVKDTSGLFTTTSLM